MQPPAEEARLGLGTYLTDTPGIGGRLRAESEDFQVIELGSGPRRIEEGRLTAVRIRLRNWETNRFCNKAAQRLKVKRQRISFAGMKDKRAVTEQWFTMPCKTERVFELNELQDVEVLEAYPCVEKHYAGAHTGNRFVLRVRDHEGEPETVDRCLEQIRSEGGVPHYFGPQRFGSGVRPITHLMGKALVAGDLKEAVYLYCGRPMEGEREDTYAARKAFEETGDPEVALPLLPRQLDLERDILQRLAKKPEDWDYAIRALPRNLLTLFIHSWQSFLYNHMLTARIEAGLGLSTAHIGDRVMAHEEDGTRTVLVTESNQARVQEEIRRGRASATALLVGTDTPLAEGPMGEIEARILKAHGVTKRQFRCFDMPGLSSPGRRRGILQNVTDLESSWVDGDPVIAFALGRGSYATVVMREVMKAGITDY